jgi:hypothetical protein
MGHLIDKFDKELHYPSYRANGYYQPTEDRTTTPLKLDDREVAEPHPTSSINTHNNIFSRSRHIECYYPSTYTMCFLDTEHKSFIKPPPPPEPRIFRNEKLISNKKKRRIPDGRTHKDRRRKQGRFYTMVRAHRGFDISATNKAFKYESKLIYILTKIKHIFE